VALGDITRQAVIAAITEYDELGQDQFLSKYGFERARSYVLVHDGKSYDSKAIVGAAHGFLPGQSPLRARQFSGGEATVGRLLRRLGFIVPVGDVSESAGRSLAETAFASLAEKQRLSLAQEYQRLCGRADVYWQGRDDKRTTRTSSVPIRHEDARRAVMLRSQGHCENPRCTGDVQDLTDAGDPILEVDHIHDLAQGGEDNPGQMIALCPNCLRMDRRWQQPAGKYTGGPRSHRVHVHVGIVISGGEMIEAYATGFPIRVSTFGQQYSPPGDQVAVGFTRPAQQF
jgi:5-methylcytosine-specific restriction endonuclease McrA